MSHAIAVDVESPETSAAIAPIDEQREEEPPQLSPQPDEESWEEEPQQSSLDETSSASPFLCSAAGPAAKRRRSAGPAAKRRRSTGPAAKSRRSAACKLEPPDYADEEPQPVNPAPDFDTRDFKFGVSARGSRTLVYHSKQFANVSFVFTLVYRASAKKAAAPTKPTTEFWTCTACTAYRNSLLYAERQAVKCCGVRLSVQPNDEQYTLAVLIDNPDHPGRAHLCVANGWAKTTAVVEAKLLRNAFKKNVLNGETLNTSVVGLHNEYAARTKQTAQELKATHSAETVHNIETLADARPAAVGTSRISPTKLRFYRRVLKNRLVNKSRPSGATSSTLAQQLSYKFVASQRAAGRHLIYESRVTPGLCFQFKLCNRAVPKSGKTPVEFFVCIDCQRMRKSLPQSVQNVLKCGVITLEVPEKGKYDNTTLLTDPDHPSHPHFCQDLCRSVEEVEARAVRNDFKHYLQSRETIINEPPSRLHDAYINSALACVSNMSEHPSDRRAAIQRRILEAQQQYTPSTQRFYQRVTKKRNNQRSGQPNADQELLLSGLDDQAPTQTRTLAPLAESSDQSDSVPIES